MCRVETEASNELVELILLESSSDNSGVLVLGNKLLNSLDLWSIPRTSSSLSAILIILIYSMVLFSI